MKFQLAINLERLDDSINTSEIAKHTLEMVQMADEGGFRIAWAAEHHALEMTIAPNPFQILTWWSSHTNRIRLGTAVAVAAYWHPIRLAGEAAFLDLISNGRLELGLGSGAYQREFDRMHPGLNQCDAWKYLHEMLPILRKLWQGDYTHKGDLWSFPSSTSVPKPLQKDVPIWIAARSPATFNYAIENNCNIMSWPINRPLSEIKLYHQRFNNSLKIQSNNQFENQSHRPIFAVMRHTALYEKKSDWEIPVQAVQKQLGQFQNLFKNLGDVENGFPKIIPFENLENQEQYKSEILSQNMMFGTPEEVIEKLKSYQKLGVDEFIYYASMGLELKEQKKSMELFCREIIPAFK